MWCSRVTAGVGKVLPKAYQLVTKFSVHLILSVLEILIRLLADTFFLTNSSFSKHIALFGSTWSRPISADGPPRLSARLPDLPLSSHLTAVDFLTGEENLV